MKAIVFDHPGSPEAMRLAEVPDPLPRAGEVLVRVRAAGVNRADLLQRLGRYPAPPGASEILGLELAGEVVALGPGCTRRRAGDRVMAVVTGGGYATLAIVPEAATMLVPASLDWRAAGAIPEAFLTAYLNLFDLCGLAPGETVLVHAGASGVGSAAIQLAREAGATVLATAGSDEKLQFCRELGAARAIHRESEDWGAVALEATGDKGVHIILDFVGAPYWPDNMRALRRGGRLAIIGFLGSSRGDIDLGPVLRKSLTVRGTTLRGLAAADKAALVERASAFMLPRFADGRLRALVDRAFPLAAAAEAHHYMHANSNRGKIILEP
jgi:tumor protein p53-inducible protein 3